MINPYLYLFRYRLKRLFSLCAITTSLLFASGLSHAEADALEESAVKSPLAAHSMMLDIEQHQGLIVAVGERGHILRSIDNAQSWQQAEVPVRVTLTSSYFVNENAGWAVGHDGVVLRTGDGGKTWQKILDGYQANQLMYQLAKQQVIKYQVSIDKATDSGREALEIQLEELQYGEDDARAFIEEGAGRPFLDLWFRNEKEGFIVGALGLFLKTTDGGNSWTPWADHIENADLFHLNSISKIGQQLFITGEAGSLFISNNFGENWQTIDSPYEGSLFGVVGTANESLIVYGLRGNAFISHNLGKSWQKIITHTDASLFGAVLLDNSNAIIVGGNGVMLQIDSQGKLINKSYGASNLPISSVVSSNNNNNIIIAGFSGVKTVLLSLPSTTSTNSEKGVLK